MEDKMRYKKIAAGLMAMLIVVNIAGCNAKNQDGKADTEVAMGRYVEETIPMPKSVEEGKEITYEMIKNPEGNVEIYSINMKDTSKITQYILKKDDTWESNTPKWLNQNGAMIDTVICASDGTRYAIASESGTDNKKIKVKVLKIKDNENCEEVTIDDYDREVDRNKSPKNIGIISENRILFTFYDGKASIYNNGKEIESFKGAGYDYALSDNKLMLANEKADGVFIADTDTGDTISEVSYSGSLQNAIFAADKDGNWYVVSNLGILRLVKGGSLWETILDGSMASMSMPSISPESVIIGKKDDFYVMYQGENGKREIKHYVYDKDMPAVPGKTLTVTSLYENSTVRQAAAEFQRKNRDVKVDYKAVMTKDDSTMAADYIKKLNIELLAGKGSDIILLDNMPAASYIEKGVLADLGNVINPMLDSGEILDNIIKPYEEDGKIYMVPLRVGVPVAFGKKGAVNSITSLKKLADYAKDFADIPLLGSNVYSFQTLTSLLFKLYAGNFTGGDVTLDKEELVQFLESLKVISDQTQTVHNTKEAWDDIQYDTSLAAQIIFDKQAEIGFSEIYSMLDVYVPFAALDITKGELVSVNQEFIPSGLTGVNNSSDNKELAFEFIKELFSEDVQKKDLMDGFPVNSKALENFDLAEDDFWFGMVGFEATQPSIDKMKTIIDMCKTLTLPVNKDEKFLAMVTDEASAYLKGNIEVTAAADKIIERAKAYLSE
jgi:ABC-type glycerol-3-phosphate transport system substrate-binding protein